MPDELMRFNTPEVAQAGEPMFTLLASDPIAAQLVRQWATMKLNSTPMALAMPDEAAEAFDTADRMDAWYLQEQDKKKSSEGLHQLLNIPSTK